jgi:hypothetical protein
LSSTLQPTLQPIPLQFATNILPSAIPFQPTSPLLVWTPIPPPVVPSAVPPTNAPPPTDVPPPAATATPHQRIILRIQARGGDNLYIQNQSPNASLPLAGLEIRWNGTSVSGTGWNASYLDTTECVRIQKPDAHNEMPKDMTCNVIGTPIVLDNDDPFWHTRPDDSIDVVYNGNVMDTCTKDQVQHSPGCNVRVLVPVS